MLPKVTISFLKLILPLFVYYYLGFMNRSYVPQRGWIGLLCRMLPFYFLLQENLTSPKGVACVALPSSLTAGSDLWVTWYPLTYP